MKEDVFDDQQSLSTGPSRIKLRQVKIKPLFKQKQEAPHDNLLDRFLIPVGGLFISEPWNLYCMLMAKEKHVKEFSDDVKSLFGDRVSRIILYGSYAKEEEAPGSDIDIAVILEEKKKEDRKEVQELAERWMQDIDLRFSPRVFEKEEFEKKAKQGYGFHENVEKEGVEI